MTENESFDDLARVTVSAEVGHGETLTLTKLLAYGWSSQRSMVSIRDQADAALASARRTGFDGLLDDQREYLDDFWERADVEIDGDDELQQAVRFALFHTLQAAARAEKRAIPAKGLTGDGYDGHVFWDTESFVLPVLTYTAPETVRDALVLAPLDARPRHRARAPAAPRGRRVPVADDPRPRVLGLLAGGHGRLPRQRRHRRRGAALPARDRRRRVRARRGARAAGGDGAAVALARPPRRARRRSTSTASRGPTSTRRSPTTTSTRTSWPPGTWPARRSRARAIASEAAALGVDDEEMAAWRDAAGAIAVPYDEELGVHQQSAGYTRHERWDFEATDARRVPAAAALPLLRPLPQAGGQAGRPRARDGRRAAIASRPRRRRAPSPTTSR